MKDSEIIWRYISREFPDSHQCIYLYVSGTINIRKVVITQILLSIKPVFNGAMSDHIMETVVKGFLERKKAGYIKGEFDVKSIY